MQKPFSLSMGDIKKDCIVSLEEKNILTRPISDPDELYNPHPRVSLRTTLFISNLNGDGEPTMLLTDTSVSELYQETLSPDVVEEDQLSLQTLMTLMTILGLFLLLMCIVFYICLS